MAEVDKATPQAAPAAPETNAPEPGGADAPAAPAAPEAAPAAATSSPFGDVTPEQQQTDTSAAAMQQKSADQMAAAEKSQAAPEAAPMAHERLFKIVQAIGAGLSGMGTAISTGGRAGGAKETADIINANQQQRNENQRLAMEKKNVDVQQHIALADTAQKQSQNIMNLSTLHANQVRENFTLGMEQANYRQEHGGMDPQAFSSALTAPDAAGSGKMNPYFKTQADQAVDAASKVLKPDDPYLTAVQHMLLDPNTTAGQLFVGTQRLISQQHQQSGAAEEQAKVYETQPIGDLKAGQQTDMLNQRWNVLNQNKPMPDSFKVKPTDTPKDITQIDSQMQKLETSVGTARSQSISNALREIQLQLMGGGAENQALVGLEGPAFMAKLQTVNPGRAYELKEYLDGRMEMSQGMQRSPTGQAILRDLALASQGTYDQSKAPSYMKLRNEFTSGKTASGLNAYNTMMNHIGRMYDNIKAGNIVNINVPGTKEYNQLQTDRIAVSTEIAKALAAGQMTEGEQKSWQNLLDTIKPSSAIDRITELAKLGNGKLDAYDATWAAGAAKNAEPPSSIHTSEEQAVMQKILGGESGDGGRSGKAVSLAAAMALPVNKGKTADQVRADIESHGHQVTQ